MDQRGLLHRLRGDNQQALTDLNKAIHIEPHAWRYKQRGLVHRLQGNYEEAIADFNKTIELYPNDAWALANRAELFLLTQRYDDALVDIQQALVLDSQSDWEYFLQSLCYTCLNDPPQAQTSLDTAICTAQETLRDKPENWRVAFNLALYHLVAGDEALSEQQYRTTIASGATVEAIGEAIEIDLGFLLRLFPDHAGARRLQGVLRALYAEKVGGKPV